METKCVYRVKVTGVIYANLASAVEDCVKRIRQYDCELINKPMLVQIADGYQVMLSDMQGKVYKRSIEVIVPKYLVDELDCDIDIVQEKCPCCCKDK
jgi:hypothetical protein